MIADGLCTWRGMFRLRHIIDRWLGLLGISRGNRLCCSLGLRLFRAEALGAALTGVGAGDLTGSAPGFFVCTAAGALPCSFGL